MALSDVTGVFSRYFIVGFFLPAYIALVALWLTATSRFIPDSFESHSQSTQLLILGAVALVAGLGLTGLKEVISGLFVGAWPRGMFRLALSRQRMKFHRLEATRDDPQRSQAERTRAALALEHFPYTGDRVLPTRLGNIMRAYDLYSNRRWGLDGVTIWPRVEAVLTDAERELLLNATTDLFLLLNAAFGAYVIGILLVADKVYNGSAWPWALYLLPFVIGYLLYRLAEAPALERGTHVSAGIDLHRLEVYEKLGVRAPTSFTDERSQVAPRVNQALVYGKSLPDELWGASRGTKPGKNVREDSD